MYLHDSSTLGIGICTVQEWQSKEIDNKKRLCLMISSLRNPRFLLQQSNVYKLWLLSFTLLDTKKSGKSL